MARQSMEIRGETVEEKIHSIGVILKKLWVQGTARRVPTPILITSYIRELPDRLDRGRVRGLISSHLMLADGNIFRIGIELEKNHSEEVTIFCSVGRDGFIRGINLKEGFAIVDESIQVQKGDLVVFYTDDLSLEDISISFLYNMSAKSLIESDAF